jgi:secondary thiamine-phosphate synthase enzyme
LQIHNETFHLASNEREELIDITAAVSEIVAKSGMQQGLVSVYVGGATAAIMIQENWDDSVQRDVIDLLQKLVPRGVWQHDRQDGNGDAHLKAGLVGPSEQVPLAQGKMQLSSWQNIFLCEFDGPRQQRPIHVTILGSN